MFSLLVNHRRSRFGGAGMERPPIALPSDGDLGLSAHRPLKLVEEQHPVVLQCSGMYLETCFSRG